MLLVGSTSPIELDGRRIAARFARGDDRLDARRGRRRIARGPARHVGDRPRRPRALRRRRRPGHRRPSADRARRVGAARRVPARPASRPRRRHRPSRSSATTACSPTVGAERRELLAFYGASLLAYGRRQGGRGRRALARGARPRPGQPVLPLGGDGRTIGNTCLIAFERHREAHDIRRSTHLLADPRSSGSPRAAHRRAAADPLPSWNDTVSKKAIVAFVAQRHEGGLAGLRPGRRAHRHLRQRRHALGRAADVLPALLRPRPRSRRSRRSTRSGRTRSRSPRCSRAT